MRIERLLPQRPSLLLGEPRDATVRRCGHRMHPHRGVRVEVSGMHHRPSLALRRLHHLQPIPLERGHLLRGAPSCWVEALKLDLPLHFSKPTGDAAAKAADEGNPLHYGAGGGACHAREVWSGSGIREEEVVPVAPPKDAGMPSLDLPAVRAFVPLAFLPIIFPVLPPLISSRSSISFSALPGPTPPARSLPSHTVHRLVPPTSTCGLPPLPAHRPIALSPASGHPSRRCRGARQPLSSPPFPCHPKPQ
ncbi:hypothetical protein T484DRAFT_3525303, partial [Baffinella frigidus]